MSRYGSGEVGFFLIDGYNILSDVTDVSTEFEEVLEETTTLGEDDQTFEVVGLGKAMFSLNGFFNDLELSIHDALLQGLGTSMVVCLAVAGNTAGRVAICYTGGLQGKYKKAAARAELTKVGADFTGTGIADEDARIMATLAARTTASNGDTTSVDGGAASPNGGRAYIQATALTLGGYTNVAVKLRDSPDNVTFTDITAGAFTAITAVPVAQAITIPGAIDRYVLVRQNFTGAGTGQTITYAVCLARNP